MKNEYLDSINKDIKNWTYKRLVANPLLCKDEGSRLIVLNYIYFFYSGLRVEELPPKALSDGEKVRRYRNIILKDFEDLDKRKKFKPKKKAKK